MKKHKSSALRRERAPKPPVQSLIEPPEEGLSVDPEELGPSFLRYATEQDNFETARAAPREFAPAVEPPSDDAPRESTTSAGSLWERTVDKVLADREPVDLDQLEEPFEPQAGAEGDARREGE